MSMVERVARALCRLDGHSENATMDGKPLWQDYLPEARAAIEAMRLDPAEQSVSCSTDIVDAGRIAWMEWEIGPDDFKKANAATVDSWNAMIDSALGKEE